MLTRIHGRLTTGRAPGRFSLGQALLAALLAEQERWILWLPVGLGAGIALYFALPAEPALWPAPLLAVLSAAVFWRWRRRDPEIDRLQSFALVAILPAAAALTAAGLAAAQLRTLMVEAPVLERRGAYEVEGRVLLVEERVRGERLLLGELRLDHARFGELPADELPATVRFSRRSAEPPLFPGDRIQARAMLMPPSPPSEPHGFDFARQAFFSRLGAVGYSLSPPVLVERDGAWRFDLALAGLRQRLAGAISAPIGGAEGAVAVALLTGLRGAIPDHVWTDMQLAGMAHLLAISGLHLGLVAGTLFFLARVGIALIPPLALRLPAKKLAAAFALVSALVYLLLTGATVPTQRAFIMTALMLLAVMVDRNPFSMRLVAFAGCGVLLSQPESLLGASFQMSFAAVVALIAVYETGIGRPPAGAAGLDWRLLMYVLGVVLTTVIASTATAPLGVYHFGRLPTYGVLANVLAVPLTAFWIMPLGLLGLLLLPLGLATWPFYLMGLGIGLMLDLAAWVADLPGAALAVARPPVSTLVLVTLGGLWLALWQTGWRRLGLVPVAAGLLLAALHRQPDVLIEARGSVIAVRGEDGRLALAPWRKDGWVTDGWLRGAGQEDAAAWPEPGSGRGFRCDPEGCVVARSGHVLALSRSPRALLEDCRRADLVISYPRIEQCPSGRPLIGPRALRRAGGIALWLEPGRIRRLDVRQVRGDRPWTR
jgi:competence protein ComEC